MGRIDTNPQSAGFSGLLTFGIGYEIFSISLKMFELIFDRS